MVKSAGEILHYLEENEYLEYGEIIPVDVFINLCGVPFSDTWNFLGPFLDIKQIIEEEGYLCTTQGLAPGYLKIINMDEMPGRADRIFKTLSKKMKRLQKTMINAKIEEFDKHDLRKHLHITDKITAAVSSLNSILRDI